MPCEHRRRVRGGARRRSRRNFRDELESAELYRRVADAEPDEGLAAAEDERAAWRGRPSRGWKGVYRGASGNALRASVLGANDGLLPSVSLVMGVAGARLGSTEILITCLAGLPAGRGHRRVDRRPQRRKLLLRAPLDRHLGVAPAAPLDRRRVRPRLGHAFGSASDAAEPWRLVLASATTAVVAFAATFRFPPAERRRGAAGAR